MPIYKRFGRFNSLLKRWCCSASGPNLLSCADITNQQPQTEETGISSQLVSSMTTEQTPAILSCAPSAVLAIPEPVELTWHRWKPTNPLTTQGAARSRSWCARRGRRLPDGTGWGCLRGSLQLPIEVTSTSSFLLLPHKAFDLLASILLGIDLFWSFFF